MGFSTLTHEGSDPLFASIVPDMIMKQDYEAYKEYHSHRLGVDVALEDLRVLWGHSTFKESMINLASTMVQKGLHQNIIKLD